MGTVEQIDHDREARKHLWRGLSRLPVRERVAFVDRMARSTSLSGTETRVTDHTGTVHEAYYDLMLLAAVHGLDLYRACGALESLLKWR